VGNIEYGNIDFNKFKFENGNFEFNLELDNIDSKTGSNGVKRGWGGVGGTADDDRGCYDPVLPRFTPCLTPFYCRCRFFSK